MAKFEVGIQGLKNNSNNFDNYRNCLEAYSNRVNSIRNRLYIASSSSWSIKNSLRVIADGIVDESRSCRKMSDTIQNISSKYEIAENKICGNSKASWSDKLQLRDTVEAIIEKNKPLPGVGAEFIGINSGPIIKEPINNIERTDDFLFKTIAGVVGPFGVIADMIRNGVKGKTGDFWGGLTTLAGGIVENWEGSRVKWGDWIGTGPLGTWQNELGKYVDFSSAKKGFSTVCNWVASYIGSGIDNYGEHNNLGERFWRETVTEGTLKLVEGMAIGAGVTFATGAIATAIGVTAPAWVGAAAIAGVTVLVDWGLDWVVSKVTKGTETSWVEFVSDGLINASEYVGDKVTEVVENVADAVSRGIDNIGNAIRNIGGSICNWGRLRFN